ncbi:hypothetical protein DV735_g4771, partial [Chaetothyriales sp. CBS 134920]
MPRPRAQSATSEEMGTTEEQQGVQEQELGSMYDYLAKIILLGPSGSGKSCLLHRFINQTFRVLSSQTIGVEFSSKIVKIGTPPNGKRIKLQLWDTAGTERFRSVSRSYYRGAAGAILVYDVASLRSFAELPTFLMDARALASPGLVCAVAGNKSDLADPTAATTTTTTTVDANGIAIGGGNAADEGFGSGFGESLATTTAATATPSSASIRSGLSGFSPQEGAGSTTFGSIRSRDSIRLMEAGVKWTASTSTEGRQVAPEVADRWASRNGVPVCMEVSALTGDRVDELFSRLAGIILTKIELGEIDPDDPRSGIQYGDVAGWDGIGSGGAAGPAEDGSLRRRKKGGAGGRIMLNEWADVFRPPGTRSKRCC